MNDIALRYNKDIIPAETAYLFTTENTGHCENIIEHQTIEGYPATPESQERMLADIKTVVRAIPGGRRLGVFGWDTTWTAVDGND